MFGPIDAEKLLDQCRDLLETHVAPIPEQRRRLPWVHLKILTPELEKILGHAPKGWTVLCETNVFSNSHVSERIAEMLKGKPSWMEDIMWQAILGAAVWKGMPVVDWDDSAGLGWILFRIYGTRCEMKRNFAECAVWTKRSLSEEDLAFLDGSVQRQVWLAINPPKVSAASNPGSGPGTLF